VRSKTQSNVLILCDRIVCDRTARDRIDGPSRTRNLLVDVDATEANQLMKYMRRHPRVS